ncbi:MerR family transcriptional regulator [Corynebacterium heidelbergense]|uniref:MerR family transcriptional regulator n=1 Tax=Corynebacterium heidelbergense TaxID=2055947 RepID=A0A364V575_9CORY|nr:MerR family transcriptional regulator [Corynebacterium heidelbergense]RAV31771.1 MerR family transcriptional regulator [Corynebacterium heidelbergense]
MDDSQAQNLTVGQAAAFLGVTVKTLHHWDHIGLLTPQWRSWADYRLYTSAELRRGQRILVYRSAGVPLQEIGSILDGAGDELSILQHQHELLTRKRVEVGEMLDSIDSLIQEAIAMSDHNIDPRRAKEIMGDKFHEEWHEEAQARWGHTPEWGQAMDRMAQLEKPEWDRYQEQFSTLGEELRQAHDAGVRPDSARAAELVAEHRSIVGWWYECTLPRQVLLCRLYTQDERFSNFLGRANDGTPLVSYLAELVNATARAKGLDPETCKWD